MNWIWWALAAYAVAWMLGLVYILWGLAHDRPLLQPLAKWQWALLPLLVFGAYWRSRPLKVRVIVLVLSGVLGMTVPIVFGHPWIGGSFGFVVLTLLSIVELAPPRPRQR